MRKNTPMVNVYIDTNCYIFYVQNKLPEFKNILILNKKGIIQIFHQPKLDQELLGKTTIPRIEAECIQKILEPLAYREKPFTVGLSWIGGPDYLSRFSNVSGDVTIQEIKDGISKAIFPAKKSLSNSDKNDVELYSEAVNLGCEYFITENTRDFGKTRSKKRERIKNFDIRVKPICRIMTVGEFLEEIRIRRQVNELF